MKAEHFKYDGVKIFEQKGKIYAYHRKTGTKLKSPIGTPAFQAELDLLNGKPTNKPIDGTLAALFIAYRSNPEFTRLAARTRADYQKIMDFLRPGAGRQLVARLRPVDILDIRDMAYAAHKVSFANYCIVFLRLLLKWAVARDWLATNPAAAVEKLKRPADAPQANRMWSERERETVLGAATGGLKVAIALGMFACMREGDALSVTTENYTGTHLRWRQGKTRQWIEIPVDPELQTILDDELAARVKFYAERAAKGEVFARTWNLVANAAGRPYTNDGFRTMLWKLLNRLEQAGAVMPDLTFHGLRHTAATRLADLGASPHTIAALLGHKSLVMATLYASEANQKLLASAGVALLRRPAG
jgi:integrase